TVSTRSTTPIGSKEAARLAFQARATAFHAPRGATEAAARVFSARDRGDGARRASDRAIFTLWTAVNTWTSAGYGANHLAPASPSVGRVPDGRLRSRGSRARDAATCAWRGHCRRGSADRGRS